MGSPYHDGVTSPRVRLGTILLPLAILLLLAIGVGADSSVRTLVGQTWRALRVLPVLVTPAGAGCGDLRLLSGADGVAARMLASASFNIAAAARRGNNMLPILPGLGDAIGTRVMVLAGVRLRAAVTVRALDILAEVLGQAPYIALAFVVLSRFWQRAGRPLRRCRAWAGRRCRGLRC